MLMYFYNACFFILTFSVKNSIEVIELFKHRADKLEKKVHNLVTGWITEYFAPGRPQSLKGIQMFIYLKHCFIL